MLATPVSKRLKKRFPQAHITYFTHGSLFPLLRLCPSIDNLVEYHKSSSLFETRALLHSLKPDLIVDLSGSSRSFIQTCFLSKKIFRYQKQPAKQKPIRHAALNYLDSIAALEQPEDYTLFPTLSISESEKQKLQAGLTPGNKALLALVPGVGAFRPHRAWPVENWITLSQQLKQSSNLVLVGGNDDSEICRQIENNLEGNLDNLCGKLSLEETAALFSLCTATISGDTGPAHISVAVGTPTITLHGPTYAERSGAYSTDPNWLEATANCQCLDLKRCRLTAEAGPGRCMSQISVLSVLAKIEKLLQ
ncbi:MAG: glycosyltransferase family 9 protein [Candidatus Obscuribacterales bacterium]|nr:glycosyltransferase family 9 protein [Candidatus Obscuribacterales bacterium]